MNLVAFHGFLGSSEDFQKFEDLLEIKNIWKPDLFGQDQFLLRQGFDDFVSQAQREIAKRFGFGESHSVSRPHLLGYSLGGRLALHLALHAPDHFDKVVLLSTHPGIFEPSQKKDRQEWEEGWLESLIQDSFEDFWWKWQNQPLFAHDELSHSPKFDLDKKTLKSALSSFSNTRHQFTLDDLKKLSKKLIWVSGEKDLKFQSLMEKVRALRPADEFLTVPQAGHRLIARKDLTWLSALFSS